MEYPAFCVNCGQKLTPDIKFCPKCGNKICNQEQEDKIENNQKEMLYSHYQEKIENAVAESYLSEMKLNRNNLYEQGKKYNYTKDRIDNIISDYEKKINQYIDYLGEMYLKGASLLMEVTDEIQEECAGYAEFIGLKYEEGEEIFDKFIHDNKIQEKSGILVALLTYYSDTGKFEEVKSNEGDTAMDAFKQNEYIHLRNVVEKLLNLQKELYVKSDSIYLSKEDEKKITEEAQALGFPQEEEYIDAVIRGNEINLGYSWKQEKERRNKLKKVNQDKLSRIALPQNVSLKGERWQFGSCYFAKDKIKAYYQSEIRSLKTKSLEEIKKYDVSAAGSGQRFISAIGKSLIQWINLIEKFNNETGVSQEVVEEMKASYYEVFHSFKNDLNQVENTFDDIEQGVEETKIKGDLNKALRGKWRVVGVGIDGAINGAITQTILNTGTGMAYSAINGVAESVARHNSQNAKEKLRDAIVPVVGKFWDMLMETTSDVYIGLLCEKYPFIIWQEDKEYESKLLEEYKAADDKEKISVIKDLILANPYNPVNYALAFYEIQKEKDPQKDVGALMKIAQWFNLKSKVAKEIFTMLFDSEEEISKDTCNELLHIETLLQSKYIPTQSKIYKKYLETEIEKILSNYTPEEINTVLKLLEDFNREYEYSTDFLEEEVQNKVFSYYKIRTNPRTIEDFRYTIKQLKYLDENCSWEFEKKIDELERRLENLLEKKDKESRTVEIIKKYDIASKKVKKEKILVKSAEIKDKMVLVTPEIEAKCLKLSFEMGKNQFDEAIQEIRSLCTVNEYDQNFLVDLQEQWDKEDKITRTVQGIEYETREEASEAKSELKEIEKLYEGYKKSYTQKYLSLMKCSFKTKPAKEKVKQKEKELIQHVADLEKNKNYTALNDTANSTGAIMKAVGITVVILILNAIFSSGLLKAICLMVVIGVWISCMSKISDNKKNIESGKRRAEESQKELDEFHSVFKIEGNHIVENK